MTLSEAILAVEKSQTTIASADTADAAAALKLQQAMDAKAQTASDDSAAVNQGNSDLDALIAVATAQRRPAAPPPQPTA